jgi:trk system potassium uptake protein TrkH
MRWVLNLSFVTIVMGIGALAMFVPVLHALALRDWLTARSFFYSGSLFLTLTLLIAIASYNRPTRNLARSHLVAMLAVLAVLPLMLAVPFYESVRNTSYLNAYFEMVSSLTTTGATLFPDPGRLAPSVHLWRAIVGWLGGYFTWLTAIAILAPMSLGGFEVTSPATVGRGARQMEGTVHRTDPRERLLRFNAQLLPIYAGLSGLLWLLLILAGDTPFVAACHAMAVLSTSGISPVGGLSAASSGFLGELLIFVFLFFAISRQTFGDGLKLDAARRLAQDREFRMGLIALVAVPLLLFARHWLGAYEVAEQQNFAAALRALWGSVFTVLSFLSTTGFTSTDWVEVSHWSGLQTPGLILVGLAVVGGGVATTAGGVKLLRVYALYKHGQRELEKLFYPSSVGGAGAMARLIRREGAHIAWVFFMLFAFSVVVVMAALSLTGLGFEKAMVLTVSALSTTGPLASVAAEAPILFDGLDDAAKMILAATMVLGRLETLAIIAMLNPGFWRQ